MIVVTFRMLRADEIECRVGAVTDKGLSLLLYKDARCDMNILDETVGPEMWQRRHELINGNLYCSVGIWSETLRQWVWKQDVGTESKTEAEKGEASDSFKRACFNWGIGRELYTAPFIWINKTDAQLDGKRPGERFRVTDIEYDGRVIKSVKILLEKSGKSITFMNGKPVPAEKPKPLGVPISAQRKALIEGLISKGVFTEQSVLERYKVAHLSDLTEDQANNLILAVNQAIAEKKARKETAVSE